MELRSCNLLHFVQAIKSRSEVKVLNVFRGKPALKFKKLEDIYGAGYSENCDLVPVFRPKLEFVDMEVDSERTMVKSPGMLAEEKTTKGGSETVWSCGIGGVARLEDELGDLEYGTMTLKQIKESCKSQKRRYSRCPDSTREESGSFFLAKKELSCSLSNENDDDVMMQPLSSWKSRILKNNAKRKGKEISARSSSQNAKPVVNSEEFSSDRAISQPNDNVQAPIHIKVEVPETRISDRLTMLDTAIHSSCGFDKPFSYPKAVYVGELEDNDGCALKAGMPVVHGEDIGSPKYFVLEAAAVGESNTDLDKASDHSSRIQVPSLLGQEPLHCVVNEQCFEFVDEPDFKSTIVDNTEVNTSHSMKISSSDTNEDTVLQHTTIDDCTDVATPHGTFFRDENECCIVDEHSDYIAQSDLSASRGETITTNDAELTTDHVLDPSLSESGKENFVMDHLPHDSYPEKVSPAKIVPQVYNVSQSLGIHKNLKTRSNSQAQGPQVESVDSLQLVNASNIHVSSLSQDGVEDDGAHFEASTTTEDDAAHFEVSTTSSPISDSGSLWYSHSSPYPDDRMVSDADRSPFPIERQSSVSACSDVSKNYPNVVHANSFKLVTPAYGDAHHLSKLQHPPEKLLSSRKIISPTSQKRLRQAMESSELDEEEHFRHVRELCYRKLTEDKIGKLEEANQNKRDEVSMHPKQATKKLKSTANDFHQKSILKAPYPSRPQAQLNTGYSSVQSISDSAISFSQQQLRDIVSTAAKLTTELKSMKDIVEEALHHRTIPAISSKYTADEVRNAIQNATQVEESSKKWLSILSRDCNRFCKIMQMTSRGSTDSRNAVLKKRKIVFADEAGGKLCDVRTFENELTASLENNTDKTAMV
ncbi:hypothetical protein K2173_027939 [Erythroxylum novogranatense]|uniref:Uncharacterized protein n=1 Tax=Erythroxylum novogranatense TaxID=1862640 RepID=A0AAV8U0C9_9ROSI|nr:hypothetical protein K2173_027939 [Erythroxylum novogranatense]